MIGSIGLRRVSPLYLLALVLFVATLAATALGAAGDQTGLARSASVYDEGPGGTAVLRRWFDAQGVRTVVLQGEHFAVDPATAQVVFVLGASEPLTPFDVETLRRYVAGGGTLVVATEAGLAETALLEAYRTRLSTFVGGAELDAIAPVAGVTGARRISIDRGREVELGDRGLPVVRGTRAALAVVVPDGAGRLYVVGSLAPFLSGQIADDDNGRLVLALADGAVRSHGTVAFDEYHHGAHPAPDVLAILERTWPGRALVVAGLLALLYLAVTGRRLGSPLPLEHRPARSSIEHVRAFAGLVRRSGRSEIVRDRLRRDLRAGIAREMGMDPTAPIDRLIAALAEIAPQRAAEAREIDAQLSRSTQADLLRIVHRIDAVMRPEEETA